MAENITNNILPEISLFPNLDKLKDVAKGITKLFARTVHVPEDLGEISPRGAEALLSCPTETYHRQPRLWD